MAFLSKLYLRKDVVFLCQDLFDNGHILVPANNVWGGPLTPFSLRMDWTIHRNRTGNVSGALCCRIDREKQPITAEQGGMGLGRKAGLGLVAKGEQSLECSHQC